MAYIYVASSWRNSTHPQVVESIRDAGHEVYDYRHPPGREGFQWRDNQDVVTGAHMSWVLAHPEVREAYHSDADAIRRCDALVALQPYGLSTMWEIGFATGLGKPTAICWFTAYRRDLMIAESALLSDWDELKRWVGEVDG